MVGVVYVVLAFLQEVWAEQGRTGSGWHPRQLPGPRRVEPSSFSLVQTDVRPNRAISHSSSVSKWGVRGRAALR